MKRDARAYLGDIQQAAGLIAQFTQGKTFAVYLDDQMLRSAVERQFEIIGEALTQLAKLDPQAAASIREYRRAISFRNILVHGYAAVDDRLVWDIVVGKLAALRDDVAALLGSP